MSYKHQEGQTEEQEKVFDFFFPDEKQIKLSLALCQVHVGGAQNILPMKGSTMAS